MSNSLVDVTFQVDPDQAGERLDRVAASLFGTYSRSRLQGWIADGYLTVNGQSRRSKDRLIGGEQLALSLPPDVRDESAIDFDGDNAREIQAESLALSLVHEDADVFVINKPAGLVMHPAPGNWTGTLMNGLLHLDPSLRAVPRAGIVHRLDKETSGLCVVARSLEAHTDLVRQLQARTVSRRYLAVVQADHDLINGTIDEPVGRHPRDRKRMAVVSGGKHAVTHYESLERFTDAALLSVKLETGRTHQIRVHMSHVGHPLLGDPVYGRRAAVLPKRLSNLPEVCNFKRQALHATELAFYHPDTGELLSCEVGAPEDMQNLISALRYAHQTLSSKNDG